AEEVGPEVSKTELSTQRGLGLANHKSAVRPFEKSGSPETLNFPSTPVCAVETRRPPENSLTLTPSIAFPAESVTCPCTSSPVACPWSEKFVVPELLSSSWGGGLNGGGLLPLPPPPPPPPLGSAAWSGAAPRRTQPARIRSCFGVTLFGSRGGDCRNA